MRIVDLSLTYRTGLRGFSWEVARSAEKDGYNARNLHLYSHAGTHMDAQTHFSAGPETIDRISLDRCMGPARLVRRPDTAPRDLIRVSDLGPVSEILASGEILLLQTGWSRHVEQPELYRDQMPRISEELALWCVERGVRILGVEPPSVADVNDLQELTQIHRILLSGGVTIVESLANLDQLREDRVFFAALPLKIGEGDGCPCRAFAVEGIDSIGSLAARV